ncbi:MAG: glycosyltransferase family A protein, partial [Acidimicrobiales bacterium]
MLEAFVTYFQRVMDCDDGAISLIDDQGSTAFCEGTTIGIAAGRLRRKAKRRITLSGLSLQFTGMMVPAECSAESMPVHIFDRWDRHELAPRTKGLDVLAIVPAYNEADIIDQLIDYLLEQGVRVHVIDNWSTDGTFETIQSRTHDSRVTLERFPSAGPTEIHSTEELYLRIEQVADSSNADWLMINDCDEIHEAPWPRMTLAESFSMVTDWGFNCVDHTIVNFRPIADNWRPGHSLVDAIPWCEFGKEPGSFIKMNAWKNQAGPVSLATSAGHQVIFPGRRVFPYKFLLRHYPIRSQEHGSRKVFKERIARWSPAEHDRGWHTHYDEYTPGDAFIWNRSDLFRWDDQGLDLL